MTSPHEAHTAVPIHDLLKERFSPAEFTEDPVTPEQIAQLFEAARWAPSSYNEQPWLYVYAEKNDPARAALEGLLSEGNAWAKHAGLLIVSFAKKSFARNGKDNRVALHDLGAANLSLCLQATAMGLAAHQMGGFAFDKANVLLGVPDTYGPGSMIAVGRSTKSAETKNRERNPVPAFSFRDRYSGKH